ncbi:hypothetical protein [Streptomyces sp. NPDC001494]
MPRTPPSSTDRALLAAVADRGVALTYPRLERLRTAGLLPRNTRRGLGRGHGSSSEPAADLVNYLEALATLTGQGRSAHRAVLGMFLAGVVRPASCGSSDEPYATYEKALRRAFRTEIDMADSDVNHIAALAKGALPESLICDGPAPEEATEAGLDRAFAAAESAAAQRVTRRRGRLDRAAAAWGGLTGRTREQMLREEEQSLLAAAELVAPEWQHAPEESAAPPFPLDAGRPLDAGIFTATRDTCDCRSLTTHMPTSRAGRHDILDAVCFCQLDRARAVGGAVCSMVTTLRDAALAAPDDPFLQAAMALCSRTVFRLLLRHGPQLSLQRPVSIVPLTLFFLQDCRWLRSGAALLMQFALWRMPAAEGDTARIAAVFRALDEELPRPRTLRSQGGTGLLLSLDGILHSARLLGVPGPANESHPATS